MGKRLLAVVASLGLLIGLVAGVMGAGSAGAETPPQSQSDLIFFPWVPNGETLNTSNPWYGSVVIQNLESSPINLELGRTAGGVFPISAIVQPHAAYTFSAADLATQLGWSGDGGGVAAAATWVTGQLPSGICQSETGSIVVTRDDDIANLPAGMTKTADQDVLAGLPLGATVTAVKFGGNTYQAGSIFTVSGNEITWTKPTRPAENSKYTVIYTTAACTRGPLIGGVEKQAAPTDSGFAVSTDSSMTSVDGYTAIPDTDVAWGVSSKFCQQANPSGVCNNLGSYFLGAPLSGFDGTSYLPIVQGNYSGWNTYLHVTNIDASTVGVGQVTITYYSQGQGVGNQGSFVEQFTLAAGQSKTINLANDAPAGFVGSAWISAQYGIVVSASRMKTSMALTNTNVPSIFATTSPDNGTVNNGNLGVAASCHSGFCQMYAPLVYLDYNGWNTGFNIVNTSEFENQVTINVVNRDGTSVGVFTAAIPPKGMQYVYIPASQDQGLGQGSFTAAILSANAPFNATVDEVKYATGEAMSYNTTATLAVANSGTFKSAFFGNMLSLPLYQVGHVGADGVSHGDTSGINLFNPTGNTVSGRIDFYMSTGAAAGSTQIGGGTPFTIGPMGSALVAYAPSQANITPGSQLSAVVTVTGGKGGVVGVSNEVNYDVNGDGGLVFNMLNLDGQYRYACSQTTCGSPVPPVSIFPSKLTLKPNQQWHAINSTAKVTATAFDASGNKLAGVPVTFTVSGPNAGTANPDSGVVVTGSNGKADFSYTNSKAGTDTVSATAPAPNGGTLASIPPTVKVHWTIPTLTVTSTPDPIYLSDNTIGGSTPSPSYTWTWKFVVTGYSDCSDIPAISDSAVSGSGLNTGNETPPAGAWNESGNDTCTASVTFTSNSPGQLAGKTQTLAWTLASTPVTHGNTTTMTWVAPTVHVEVCTINGNTCASDNPPTNTTTTVTADANHQGSWKYTFTVTGIPADDLTTALLQASYQPGSIFSNSYDFSYGEPGSLASLTIGMSAWNCSGAAPVSCTATYTNTDIDLSSPLERVPGKEIINWYLDLNGNGTQDGVDPTSNDNPTTVNYVAAGPSFDATVEVKNLTDSTTNPGGFVSTINTDDFSGVISDGEFQTIYQFVYADSSISDCSTLGTVTGTKNSPTDTTSFGSVSLTSLSWIYNGTNHTCTATQTYNNSWGTQFAGKVRSINWKIQVGANTVSDGTTTINYPDFDPSSVSLTAKAGSASASIWSDSYLVPHESGDPTYTWNFQFTVTGYPDCSLIPTLVHWATTGASDFPGAGSHSLSWGGSAGNCVATWTPPATSNDASMAGKSNQYLFTLEAVNPTQTISSNGVTVAWAAPPVAGETPLTITANSYSVDYGSAPTTDPGYVPSNNLVDISPGSITCIITDAASNVVTPNANLPVGIYTTSCSGPATITVNPVTYDLTYVPGTLVVNGSLTFCADASQSGSNGSVVITNCYGTITNDATATFVSITPNAGSPTSTTVTSNVNSNKFTFNWTTGTLQSGTAYTLVFTTSMDPGVQYSVTFTAS